jgi:hypothetical protein
MSRAVKGLDVSTFLIREEGSGTGSSMEHVFRERQVPFRVSRDYWRVTASPPQVKRSLFIIALVWSMTACANNTSVTRQMSIDAVDVRLELGDTPFQGGTEPLLGWVKRSMDIVTAYYGTFPTNRLQIRLNAQDGEGIHGGQTFGYRGGFIRIEIGRDVTSAQLLNDWVLVHEMTHLALPDVGEDHAWLSEGLAVYVEGVARAQAGNRTQQDVFAEQMRSMPRGLPQPGDEGLDHTHTWGRTYWGGAMFCFLADVEIHRRTANRLGLQDAMRAVAKASGGLGTDWPAERVFATGDAATGTTVLEDLYARMKDKPVTPDLAALWTQLGVEPGATELRDDAPLSEVRKAIMRARS